VAISSSQVKRFKRAAIPVYLLVCQLVALRHKTFEYILYEAELLTVSQTGRLSIEHG
jgi:hypothetical protein